MNKLITFLVLLVFSVQLFSQVLAPTLSGNFRMGGYYFATNANNSLVAPSGYLLSGRLNLRWGELNIPISAQVNDQGLTYSRPFTRIGLSPRYKWITLHLGHRNLRYSTFVLNRRTIYGIGGELNLGKLRLGYMRGRFNDIDAQLRNYRGEQQFDRRGWVGKIGYGTDRNHVDLLFLTAKDDSNSIRIPSGEDSLFINPQQNVVFGLNSAFQLTKRISFLGDFAMSAITRDISYPSLVEETDFPLSSWIDQFRFNATSHGDYAAEAQVKYHDKSFFASLRYRRVMPGFESFGTRFLLKDLETITFDPGYTFQQGKYIWSLSLGLMRNNLNSFKLAKTQRIIGSSNLIARFGKNLTILAQYSNYSLNQQVIRDQFSLDSLLVNQVSHQMSLIPTYVWTLGNAEIRASTNIFHQSNNDLEGSEGFNQSNSYTNIGVSLSYKKLQSLWTFQINPRYFYYESSFFTNRRTSLSFTVRKDKGDGRLNLFSTVTLSNVDNSGQQFLDVNFSARVEYALLKRLVCGLNTGLFTDINRLEGRREMRSEAFLRWSF